MADVICNDVCLWINHVGCGPTRCALLGLEPGARIWLAVDKKLVLFERMQDRSDGRSTRGLKPVGSTQEIWAELYRRGRTAGVCMVDLDFVERPADADAAQDKYSATTA